MERLWNEFYDLLDRPAAYITVNLLNNSIYHWRGTLNGPDGSPYEGGMFNFEIKFQENFPASAPEFIFKTRIFHPNINSSGHVCCTIFSSGWTPRVPIRNVISYVVGLLNEPAPDNGYGGEATTICKRNIEEFNTRARQETLQYAMG